MECGLGVDVEAQMCNEGVGIIFRSGRLFPRVSMSIIVSLPWGNFSFLFLGFLSHRDSGGCRRYSA